VVTRGRDSGYETSWHRTFAWKDVVGQIGCEVDRRSWRRMRHGGVERASASPTETVHIGCVGTGDAPAALVDRLEALVKRHQVRVSKPHRVNRRVHMLTEGKHGMALRSIASIEDALERGNYTPRELEDFDHVVADLSSADPCGRLVVVHGDPGTGKTYMVRGIIEAARNVRFVLIPSQMVPSLTTPGLAELLMRQRTAVCLVIEDADMLLVERMGDNMTSISSLLNLADGIFGSLANVRIVCTTNARRLDFDPALQRNMRLCRDIEVGALQPGHAAEVYRRVTGGREPPEPFARGATLADVYKAARPGKRNAPARANGKGIGIGFVESPGSP
jgi:hypothetical protein